MRSLLVAVMLLSGCDFIFRLDAVDMPATDAQGGARDGSGGGSDAIEPSSCFGHDYHRVCLTSLPASPIDLPAVTIGTTTCEVPGQAIDAKLYTVGGAVVCVIAGTSISISQPVVAIGDHPLVLVSTSNITITSSIDVGSRLGGAPGAGANDAVCSQLGIDGGPADTTNDGGTGGAGGTFQGQGGAGGSNPQALAPGMPSRTVGAATLDRIRGGCRGGTGGANASGLVGGAAGVAGGALYLIANGTVTVGLVGALLAGGAGGDGGRPGAGGGGGGGGGMIGIDAATIAITGIACANGGGGAGGGSTSAGGAAGADACTTSISPASGGSSAGGASSGGAGSQRLMVTGSTASDATTGGAGGGGGGAGYILLHAASGAPAVSATMSPPPLTN